MSSQSACPSERYARSFIPSSGLWDFFEGGKQCLEPSGVPQLDMDRRLLGEQPEESPKRKRLGGPCASTGGTMTIEHVLRWAMRWTAHLASCIFPPYSSVMSSPSMLSGISMWSRTSVDTFSSVRQATCSTCSSSKLKIRKKRRLVDIYSVDSPVEPHIPAIYPASAS
ncbi:hypothetical protein MGN70_014528 [Eutypa lata]|nr:hypothetical protein MGN70_014528 [Eutypa lata]